MNTQDCVEKEADKTDGGTPPPSKEIIPVVMGNDYYYHVLGILKNGTYRFVNQISRSAKEKLEAAANFNVERYTRDHNGRLVKDTDLVVIFNNYFTYNRNSTLNFRLQEATEVIVNGTKVIRVIAIERAKEAEDKQCSVAESIKKKRKRTKFNDQQRESLDSEFTQNRFPNKNDRKRMADDLGLEEDSVQFYFQNKRRQLNQTNSIAK